MQDWRTWIEHLLQEVEDHQPRQAEIAGLMGTSVRTLARHLETEGCTFRGLSNAVRLRRALEMLNQTALSVSEIARILGYSDSANFSRAFKLATGSAPQAHRAMASNLR
jgi:AraC-like DNA-binding protein